jgi:CubicO group peptidase (beta-lactamase class C family)
MIMRTRRNVIVPRGLSTHTSIDHAAECRPDEAGLSELGVSRIWSAVEGLYRTGLHPAVTLVMRRRGKIVLKRALGQQAGTGALISPDTPICLFSASKAITALLMHKLIEQGRLQLDDRIVDYIPEFAPHGKDRVTVRQLLAHRAGIPKLPVHHPDPSLLRHWDAMVQLLCLAPPFDPRFEKQAYHALTSGFIIGELVQRVSGLPLREALRDWIARPLNCRYMTYGVEPEWRAQVPRNVMTGPRPFWPISAIANHVLGLPFERAVEASNDDAYMTAVVPAGNIYASADDVSRVFQMLLNGGELEGARVLLPGTVAEAVRPLGKMQFDGTLGMPMRFSAGFMLGENPLGLFGPRCRETYGHIGFMSIIAWADPMRDVSVALLNTGKSVAPSGFLHIARILGAINRACSPTR